MGMNRLPVALLGATGVVGRQGLLALADHPWFELVLVAASARNAGRRLTEATEAGDLPAAIGDLVLQDVESVDCDDVALVFSMLPSRIAARVEPRCAATTPVFSTASTFRMEPDTPLMLAGVNGHHAELLRAQQEARGWSGWVAPGPNCTTVGLAIPLVPLREAFGVRAVVMTSLQAISGAGNGSPEVAAAVAGNVLPHIEAEEEKVELEIAKILGEVATDGVAGAAIPTSATCTRVPVQDGHTLAVSVGLEQPATVEQVVEVLSSWHPFDGRRLPSAPQRWIDVRTENDRPQPLLDCRTGAGMTTVVGRVRLDPVVGGVKFIVVTHNAVLGAAGGAVLLAEDLVDRGWIPVAS